MLALVVAVMATLPQSDSLAARPIGQLVHTTWPKAAGGPIGIRDLAQTTDGYIWIGTFFGIWRFDGVRFVHYTPLKPDSIPDGTINRLLATRDGSLWVSGGRQGAVYRIRAGRVTIYPKGPQLGPTRDLAESSTGVLVAATADGLSRFADGKWEAAGPGWGFPGKQGRALWFDRDDALWVVTEDRLVYLPAGSRQFVDPGIMIPSAPLDTRFAQERDGTIWVALTDQQVYAIRKSGDRVEKRAEIRIDPLAMILDRKGSLWIASGSDGLRWVQDVRRLHGRRIGRDDPAAERFNMKNGLLADIPTALLEDREGNIWVGSSSGLERFQEGTFTPVVAAGPGRPRFVIAGRDSSVWTGVYNGVSLEQFGPRGADRLQVGFESYGIALDATGAVLAAGGGTRLVRQAGSRMVPVPLHSDGIHEFNNLTVDPGGTIWIFSVDRGLMRVVRDRLETVGRLEEPMYHLGQPFSDSKGRIWVAQLSRVTLYADGKLTEFGPAQGINGFVYAFFEDSQGTIWVSSGDGFSRFAGDHFQTLKRKDAIPGYTVFGGVQDHEGAWWLATIPGILRFPAGEIEHALTDSTYFPRYRAFDESDGMVGALVKGYWGPILARSGDGKIWAATDSGLAVLDPRRVPVALAPPVNLEVARIQGDELAIADGAELPPALGNLEIDYTSITYATPDRIQYRYQLEGFDPDWRDVGTRRRAYYSGLAPGDYRFRVTASYGDGVWNEAGATWSFRVLPTWHQTLWFRALVVLAIGAIAGAAVALLQRRRHARAQAELTRQYEATLAERARIAQDLHDTLLQGFAGITLQLKTAEVALAEQPDVAAETLIHVQRLAHDTLREARERVWDMHETAAGRTDLASALEAIARDRTTGSMLAVSVTTTGTPYRMPRELEDAAFRIGREAIVNAVRHAQAGRIEVQVDYGPGAFHLEVRDDGCGIDALEAESARRQGHFGLSGIRERAQHLGGHCEVRPREGGGTVVALDLPLTR